MPLEHHQFDIRGVEPQEREDPRNRLLDAFRVQVEALIDQGLEPQLRAIVDSVLPRDALPPKAPAAPAKAVDYSIDRELRASKAQIGLKELEHAIRSPARKALMEPIRQIVDEEAAALRAARNGEQPE